MYMSCMINLDPDSYVILSQSDDIWFGTCSGPHYNFGEPRDSHPRASRKRVDNTISLHSYMLYKTSNETQKNKSGGWEGKNENWNGKKAAHAGRATSSEVEVWRACWASRRAERRKKNWISKNLNLSNIPPPSVKQWKSAFSNYTLYYFLFVVKYTYFCWYARDDEPRVSARTRNKQTKTVNSEPRTEISNYSRKI